MVGQSEGNSSIYIGLNAVVLGASAMVDVASSVGAIGLDMLKARTVLSHDHPNKRPFAVISSQSVVASGVPTNAGAATLETSMILNCPP